MLGSLEIVRTDGRQSRRFVLPTTLSSPFFLAFRWPQEFRISFGFAQAALHQITYFQQSIVLWLAGMCVGPAAIAWLRRTNGQTNIPIFLLTVLCVVAFFFFTIHNARSNRGDIPLFSCRSPSILQQEFHENYQWFHHRYCNS